MKHLFLPMLLLAFSLCSCNYSKLEWWEAVNTPQKRAESIAMAQKRNDDSSFEKSLFQKMDQLERNVAPDRVDSWILSDNPKLVGLGVAYYIMIAMLFIIGIIGYATIKDGKGGSWGLAVLSALFTILAVGLSIPYMLYVDNGTSGGSINFMQLILLAVLMLCVPVTIRMMEQANRWSIDLEIGMYAYAFILPFAMFLGVFIRKLATIGSYLFLLLMIIYTIIAIFYCISKRTPFFRSIFIIFYLLTVSVGTVFVFYSAMTTVAYIAFWIILLSFGISGIWGFITDPGSFLGGHSDDSDSYSSTSESQFDYNYYDMEHMRNTYKTDSDGNEIFEHDDGRYYKHTLLGFKETDKPD